MTTTTTSKMRAAGTERRHVDERWAAHTSSSSCWTVYLTLSGSVFCLLTSECWASCASLALTSPLHARATDNHADHNIVVNFSRRTRAAAVPVSARSPRLARLVRQRRNGIKWSEKCDADANANWRALVNASSELFTSSTSRQCSRSHATGT